MSYEIAPLSPGHDRAGFTCGVEALDRYLKVQAGQDARRRLSNCFVASPEGTEEVAGYYTLAAASIPLTDIAETEAKRLPRYPVLPAALVGRLAVDARHRGKGLGAALLFDALERAGRAEPAVYALLVEAKDETAGAFYRHLGFAPFRSRPLTFYLALATATRLADR